MALSHDAGHRLLASARRAEWFRDQRLPAVVLGLEQEYIVRSHGRRTDFRAVLPKLELPGATIDPGDQYARRLPSGLVITADAREAEIALPPLRRRSGYPSTVERRAEIARIALRRALGDEYELEGYSTHLSISMPDSLNDAVCQLYARTFAAAAILLMNAAEADGILIRPRPGRTELAVDYLRDGWLRVATAFAVASVRACAATLSGSSTGLPPELRVRVDQGVERFGWFVDRRAFGGDLIVDGRTSRLATVDGRILTGQSVLELSWRSAEPYLDGVAEADIELMRRTIEGREPLPGEVSRSILATVVDTTSSTAGRRQLRTAYGAIVQPRKRQGIDVVARLATWDYTVFAVSDAGQSPVFVSVPSWGLSRFIADVDAGRMDGWLTDALRDGGGGRKLMRWEQTRELAVFATLGDTRALVRPERPPEGSADGSYGRAGKLVMTETPQTASDRGSWWLIALLIGLLIFASGSGFAIGFAYGLGGGLPEPSPTPVAVLVTPSPSPLVVATPTPTPLVVATPSPTPAVVATPSPTSSPTPAVVVTPSPAPNILEAVCVRVVHEALGSYISYLDWALYWSGAEVDYFEVVVNGANDDEPIRMAFDPESGAWISQLGLRGTGDKEIVSLTAHLTDGSSVDLTNALREALGNPTLTVRFPQEDTFGVCP